jgi:hypothetical protein
VAFSNEPVHPRSVRMVKATGRRHQLNWHTATIRQADQHGERLSRHWRGHRRCGCANGRRGSAASARGGYAARFGKGAQVQPEGGRDRVLELSLFDAENE